ncbi:MAG: PAS domain-containing protein [Anaerolineales bacterium]|nr:PAS domain-containing protein [Anaerolineales bacterium]
MSVPPLDIDALMLATHVTRVFGLVHRIAYAMISADLTIQRTSPNFEAILNEPQAAIVGRPLTDVLWEFVGAEASLHAMLHGRLPYLAFERVNRMRKNGQVAYVDFLVTPVQDMELGSGLVLIIEDVTHTAELEQRLTQNRNDLDLAQQQLSQANAALQRLNRLKSLFLSMAVHDLRSPLTAVQAYSDLLLRILPADTQAKARDFAGVIRMQAAIMDWLIDDFLDLDQIEQGQLALRPTPDDLNKLVAEVTNVMQSIAERRGQTLVLALTAESLILPLDAGRIRQVLYNLLNNAVKYTPDGGQIGVSTAREADRAVLRVQDSGKGMTAEQQARAFDLYYRVEDGDEQNTRGGRGLGLFIVRTLVEAHGGEVFLESQVGHGSTISVVLPLNEAAAERKWDTDSHR